MNAVAKQRAFGKECPPVPSLDRERHAWSKGYYTVAGIDEAGRGPLAGPVVVSAVILGQNWDPGISLDDSKKLDSQEREERYRTIWERALAVRSVSVPASWVDRINILQASLLGMKLAVEQLHARPDYVLVDGNRYPELTQPGEAIVKGDALCASIAAASIVAKVTRDRIMKGLSRLYPGWGFEQHKGYPTRGHRQLLEERKPSTIHRNSFMLVRKTDKTLQTLHF